MWADWFAKLGAFQHVVSKGFCKFLAAELKRAQAVLKHVSGAVVRALELNAWHEQAAHAKPVRLACSNALGVVRHDLVWVEPCEEYRCKVCACVARTDGHLSHLLNSECESTPTDRWNARLFFLQSGLVLHDLQALSWVVRFPRPFRPPTWSWGRRFPGSWRTKDFCLMSSVRSGTNRLPTAVS